MLLRTCVMRNVFQKAKTACLKSEMVVKVVYVRPVYFAVCNSVKVAYDFAGCGNVGLCIFA